MDSKAKYEEVYLKACVGVLEGPEGLEAGFRFHDRLRPHQGPAYRTSADVFRKGRRV